MGCSQSFNQLPIIQTQNLTNNTEMKSCSVQVIDFDIVKQQIDEYIDEIKSRENYISSILCCYKTYFTFYHTIKYDKDKQLCKQIYFYFYLDNTILKMEIVDSYSKINQSICINFNKEDTIYHTRVI